jgi:pectate lyase
MFSMRLTVTVGAAITGTVALAATAVSASALTVGSEVTSAAASVPAEALSLGRQVLPVGDGWASDQGGTTGGSAADPANVYVASNRSQLVAALGGNNATNATNATPKIIFVKGRVNGNVDAENKALTCDDYAAGTGYSLDAYLAAYDPAVWGRAAKPSGPVEAARVAAAAKQTAQMQIAVGSNTTIIGLGDTARIIGASLSLKQVNNVIVRNIKFSDTADCFPQWDPTDGATGNWNSLYDSISLVTATHVWLDHNTFTDQPNLDSTQPTYFDRPYQVHDGASDIIRASDLVTVSWNSYQDHDKTMLIGSTNNPTTDLGKLRVTVHHNEFDNVLQRAPRVRFGQVDVYNNYYRIHPDSGYVYSWGVGVGSAIVAEKNYFRFAGVTTPAQVIFNWGGTAIHAEDNWAKVDGHSAAPVDLLAAFNAASDPDLGADVGWTPTLRTGVLPALEVQKVVPAKAGSGRLGLNG